MNKEVPSCPLLDYLGGLFPRARKSANKFQADLPDQQNYEKPILQEDHHAQSRKNNRRKAFGKLFFPACKKFSERNVLSLRVFANLAFLRLYSWLLYKAQRHTTSLYCYTNYILIDLYQKGKK